MVCGQWDCMFLSIVGGPVGQLRGRVGRVGLGTALHVGGNVVSTFVPPEESFGE